MPALVSPVSYLLDHHPKVKFFRKDVPRRGSLQYAPGQDVNGYGKRISTDYMAVVNNRNMRVYCCCFSNAASFYVEIKGKCYYLREGDIPDAVRFNR